MSVESGPQTGEQVLKMAIKIGEMGCLFCDSPICFIEGDMVNFQTHLEQAGMSSAQPQAEAVSLKFWLVCV